MQAVDVSWEAENLIYAHFKAVLTPAPGNTTTLRITQVQLYTDALDRGKIIFGVVSVNGKKCPLPAQLLNKLSLLHKSAAVTASAKKPMLRPAAAL